MKNLPSFQRVEKAWKMFHSHKNMNKIRNQPLKRQSWTTAADDKFCNIFPNFRKDYGIIFHENPLPADDSHEISFLICYLWKSGKIWNCRLQFCLLLMAKLWCFLLTGKEDSSSTRPRRAWKEWNCKTRQITSYGARLAIRHKELEKKCARKKVPTRSSIN